MLSDKVAAFAAGASGFLPKPFSTVDLLAEVGRQLARIGLLVQAE
jgi:DNA-binding response OmpR family regulator